MTLLTRRVPYHSAKTTAQVVIVVVGCLVALTSLSIYLRISLAFIGTFKTDISPQASVFLIINMARGSRERSFNNYYWRESPFQLPLNTLWQNQHINGFFFLSFMNVTDQLQQSRLILFSCFLWFSFHQYSASGNFLMFFEQENVWVAANEIQMRLILGHYWLFIKELYLKTEQPSGRMVNFRKRQHSKLDR